MNREILRLAIPSIITNISVPLLSAVDTALVGHLESEFYLGGVAIGAMIFNFLFWGFGFLRMGTTGLTAQAFGRHGRTEASLILMRAITVALAAGALILVLQWPIRLAALTAVDTSREVEMQATIYYSLRVWSAPAVLFQFAVQGWFLGMQNARFPMILAVFVNALTIALDLIFLIVFDMKVAGVALGTLIANYAGAVLAVILLRHSYREYLTFPSIGQLLEWRTLKRFFIVNRDIFLRTLLLILTYSFFTATSATFGDTTLAANTILLQMWMILAYGVDGFAFAAESLVGRFIGARDALGLRQSLRWIFVWGMGLGVAVSLVYWIGGEAILALFTDNAEIRAVAMQFYVWTVFAPVVNAACFLWDGAFIGATATRAMLVSMAIATLIVYFPLYFLAQESLGNHALWLAMLCYMAVRGITLSIYAPNAIFRLVPENRTSLNEIR